MAQIGGITESTRNSLQTESFARSAVKKLNKNAQHGGALTAQQRGAHTASRSHAQIENLAQFAVDEYNKKGNKDQLVYWKVVMAEDQPPAATKCEITLLATVGENKNAYVAQVLDIEWEDYKELLDFNPADDA
ncbi:hypothetical protein LguiA_012664 [Lonicera macranthoides]